MAIWLGTGTGYQNVRTRTSEHQMVHQYSPYPCAGCIKIPNWEIWRINNLNEFWRFDTSVQPVRVDQWSRAIGKFKQIKQLDTSVQPVRADQWSRVIWKNWGGFKLKNRKKAGKPVFKWNWTIWLSLNNLNEKWPKNWIFWIFLTLEFSTWLDISVEPPCVTIENYHVSNEWN